jgi:hypothetical protein
MSGEWKKDQTTARAITEAENKARAAKTAKLKEARLAKEAAEDQGQAAKKPKPAKRKAPN